MYFLLSHLFLTNILSFFSLFYPSKHITNFSTLWILNQNSFYGGHPFHYISLFIYYFLSWFPSLIEIISLSVLLYMKVYTSAYLNYKFSRFHILPSFKKFHPQNLGFLLIFANIIRYFFIFFISPFCNMDIRNTSWILYKNIDN
jgi:hypothetical protein